MDYKIDYYNERKCFGFVEQEGGGKDVFVHASAVKAAGVSRLQEGQKISFDVEDSPKGPNAINIKTEEGAEEEKSD